MKNISIPVTKVDSCEKAAGKALYVNDYQDDDLYHALTVRSSISKGEILSVSLPDLPEDVYLVGADDVPGNNYVAIIDSDWPVFADKKISHFGEPIYLMIGKDRNLLQSIRDQIVIEYLEENGVLSLEEALERTEPVITYSFDRGNYGGASDKASRIITGHFNTGMQEQAYIEPQGIIARYDESCITLTGSYQCPYYVKNALINTLGCDGDEVRVIQAVTGGAFGGKEEFPSLISSQLAVASLKLKKNIKMIYDRHEDMLVTTKRHPADISYEAAIDGKNRISGIKMHVNLDAGAFSGLSGVVLQRAMLACSGVYNFPSVDVSGGVYLTNTVPNGAFRGFGAPQTFFALEQFMNHIAFELGEDPLDFKVKHLAQKGDNTATGGLFRDKILMPDMIKEVCRMARYREKVEQYKAEGCHKGIGISLFLHGCGFTGSGEADHIKAKVKLKRREDEKVEILVANVDMGQGFKTAMIKVVSLALDLPMEEVIFNNPDTLYVPDSGPTVASRSTMIVGRLLLDAAEKLKKKKGPCIVEADYQHPEYIQWDQETLTGDAYPAYSWGVNIVEVEYDPLTYESRVTGAWAVHEIGKAVDERIVRGQVDGGFIQGIGYGLMEKMVHRNGQPAQSSLTDYMIPTASDCVTIESKVYDNPYALGPYGAKGVGELTLIGGAPAVAAAVEMAAGGIPVTRIPVVPEYMMELSKNG